MNHHREPLSTRKLFGQPPKLHKKCPQFLKTMTIISKMCWWLAACQELVWKYRQTKYFLNTWTYFVLCVSPPYLFPVNIIILYKLNLIIINKAHLNEFCLIFEFYYHIQSLNLWCCQTTLFVYLYYFMLFRMLMHK